MTIQKFAITTIASAALLTMAAPALACSHPVAKPAVHQHVVEQKKKNCDHTVVTPKATPTPTPAPVVEKKDCDHKHVATPTPTPTPKATPTPMPTPTPTPVATGQGQVLSAEAPAPASLPDTGAGLSALLGLPTLALAGRAYLRSRQS